MPTAPLIQLAEQIATAAHADQYRRDGITPYITHPRAVAKRIKSDTEAQVVAWLHDTIEDTHHTADSLQAAGIPARLIADVQLLTKDADTDYEQYLSRIATSARATKVKIADMLANLADQPTEDQVRKYASGLLTLTQTNLPEGTSCPPQLNLTVIRAADIHNSANFYRNLDLEFELHSHGNGPQHYATLEGDTVFEIYPATEKFPVSQSTRIGFAVTSCDAVVQRIQTQGHRIISRPKDSPWGVRAVVVDPDGHRVEITSKRTD